MYIRFINLTDAMVLSSFGMWHIWNGKVMHIGGILTQ